MKVRIAINEEQLLKNLRYAFTHRYTVVSELMQNARRAGASYVSVSYDPGLHALTVADDGCGIENLQHLFTVSDSGWNDSIRMAEHPFGMGFLKCLYSAKTCSVVSRGRQLVFSTQDMLAGREIEDEPSLEGSGETQITLYGVELGGLDQYMEALACGFPIAVLYNGIDLPRPYAPEGLAFEQTPIGQVHLRGIDAGLASSSSLVFLQGFIVQGDYQYGESSNIVHLNCALFTARLPDRDKLIDEDQALKRIESALRDLWRTHLEAGKRHFSDEEMAERFFGAASTWRLLDVFDEVDVLPGKLFRRIADYPYQAGYRPELYLRKIERPVRRSELEEGRIQLVELASLTAENAPLWMYARERGLICFDDPGLSDRHWVHAHVRRLDDESCQVEVVGEVLRGRLQGAFLQKEVVLCEAYSIVVGTDRVGIWEDAMYWPQGQAILIPESESSGQAVEQATDFIDARGRFHDEDLQSDRQALQHLIMLLRAKDPKRALEALLAGLDLPRYPSLRGKAFTLRVGMGVGRAEVELQE